MVLRLFTILILALSLGVLPGCMGAPDSGAGGNFAGDPPPPAGPTPTPTPTGPAGPRGFAISSGGGMTTSLSLKMKARIGDPKGGSVMSNSPSGLKARLGIHADLNDNIPY